LNKNCSVHSKFADFEENNPDISDYSQTTNWDCGLVIPGLYVGSLSAANDKFNIARNGVTHIFTAAGRLQVSPPENICHFQIDIADHPDADLFVHMEESLKFLDNVLSHYSDDREDEGLNHDEIEFKTKPAVLVHCASGVSRSVSYCCAWLMTRKGMTLSDALICIRRNHPFASPNIGFKAQLQTLQDCNGDIIHAAAIYAQRTASQNISEMIFEQRELANSLHAKVDDLELRIQVQFSQDNQIVEHEVIQTYLAELVKVQQDLDKVAHDNSNSCLSTELVTDGAAVIIRKAASQKASHLIEELMARNLIASP
jgi:protein-tyrosine phosphatase